MIIEKARELGIELSESPEFKRMNEAQGAIAENTRVMEMLESYEKHQNDIMQEMQSGGDAARMSVLSSKMDELKDALFDEPQFVELMESRNAFEELMKRVNRAIGMCIGMEPDDEPEEGCAHDCSTCSGCVH